MKRFFGLCFVFIISCCYQAGAQSSPNYEFRGVWVATVSNIDWPSKKNLSVSEQKEEFIRLVEMHQRNGMNALIVQVRPAADAVYPSPFEPWSEFLTGTQGLAPAPYYDPLAFMISETHKRGMEFHAWLNPYRAVFNMRSSSIASNHLTKTNPELFLVYGDKKYFNPGLPQVRQHTVKVVEDLVKRYDIDGVHIDDYFYPYRISGKEFPDEKEYRIYGKGMKKDDWRRSNCDSVIYELYHAIKAIKPKLRFGVSPFGIWRNRSQDPMGSETKGGQTNYDDLYADILLWLKKGWIDYVVPQLYWERGHKLADYDVLLKWWNDHAYGKDLYIGHGIYRAGSNAAWRSPGEIPQEIRELRKYNTTQGSIYFNSKVFEKNPNGWNDSLRNHYYRYPALVPAMPWIDNSIPLQPLMEKLQGNKIKLVYKGEEKLKAFGILVLPPGAEPRFSNAQLVQVIATDKMAIIDLDSLPDAVGKKVYAVSVNPNNNVSPMTELR